MEPTATAEGKPHTDCFAAFLGGETIMLDDAYERHD